MRFLTLTLIFVAGCSAPEAEAPGPRTSVRDVAAGRELLLEGRPVLLHVVGYDAARHADTFRVFDHLFDAAGTGFITKGPGGKFPHHRGLFIAWNQTRALGKRFDFWHGTEGASQQHESFIEVENGLGAITTWRDRAGTAIVRETRRIRVLPVLTGLGMEFEFVLESAGPFAVTLDGDPQHAGFQFRADQQVAERETETRFVRGLSAVSAPNDVWSQCDFALMRFSVAGVPYALLHVDVPTNPQQTVYSTRSYGRFGAFAKGLLEPGRPLTLRYLIVLGHGPNADEVEARAPAMAAAFRDLRDKEAR